MKKLVLAFVLSLFLLTSSFAFDVYDENGESRTYFSLSSSTVKVESDITFDNFTVYYELLGSQEADTFNFSSCSAGVCGEFTITDLISSVNNTFVGSKVFTISVGLANQTIYFDFENPTFSLDNYTINTQDKKLELEFSYSDNSNLIDVVELYKKEGSQLTLLENFTNDETSYDYDINSAENLTLEFRVRDQAQNTVSLEQTFAIQDVFEPTIDSLIVVSKEDGTFALDFEVSDDDLFRYEILQDNLSLNGYVSGSGYTTEVDIPFTSGTAKLVVYDKELNSANQSFNLDVSKLEINYLSNYSNTRTAKLESKNADSCTLEKVGGTFFKRNFTQSGDSFSVNLDVSTNREYDLEFYCEADGIRHFFVESFYFDTNAPSRPEMEVEAQSDGSILVTWSASEDVDSEIEKYEVIRDNNVVFTGTDRDFEDDDVGFPEEYDYFVRAYDVAGNSRDSNEESITPLKTDIDYDVNLGETQTVSKDSTLFEVDPDEEVDIKIVVKHEGVEIYKDSFSNIDDELRLDLPLEIGVNTIELELEDEFGNIQTETYFVTFEEPVLSTTQETTPEVTPQVTSQEVDDNSSSNETTVVQEVSSNNSAGWLFWIILFIAAAVALWLLLTRDSQSEKHSSKRFSKTSSLAFLDGFRRSDSKLTSDLNRIKKKREERQREKEAAALIAKKKAEKKRVKSEFEKKKLEDLSKRREIEIPFKKREQAKKRVKKIKKEAPNEDGVKKTPRSFSKKQDEGFGDYLSKVRSAKGWSNPREYYQRNQEPEKVEVKEEQPKKEEKPSEKPSQAPKKEEKQPKEPKKPEKKKVDLDDYLSKRAKKKRRFNLFTERAVDRDIRSRSKK